jgi:hypothetical protein
VQHPCAELRRADDETRWGVAVLRDRANREHIARQDQFRSPMFLSSRWETGTLLTHLDSSALHQFVISSVATLCLPPSIPGQQESHSGGSSVKCPRISSGFSADNADMCWSTAILAGTHSCYQRLEAFTPYGPCISVVWRGKWVQQSSRRSTTAS